MSHPAMWTDAEISCLRQRHAEGIDDHKIGNELGRSHQAVCNKRRDLKLISTIVSPWTDDLIALLTKRWAAGVSVTAIGLELGVTKGQVSGKIDRLKLPPPAFKIIDPCGHRQAYQYKERKLKRAIRLDAALPPQSPAPKIEDRGESIPLHQRRAFLNLTNETCRYPFGGGAEMFFCGGAADLANGHPYCDQHEKLCWAGRRPISRQDFELRRIEGRKHAAAERMVA